MDKSERREKLARMGRTEGFCVLRDGQAEFALELARLVEDRLSTGSGYRLTPSEFEMLLQHMRLWVEETAVFAEIVAE